MKSLLSILNKKSDKSSVIRKAMAALTVEEAGVALVDIFGEKINDYAKVIYIKNRILGIKIYGSSAGAEIRLNEKNILAKIREKFGNSSVEKIKYINNL